MSHKASFWLATIPPEAISPHAFRVLFHLCDAHNDMRPPELACFPGQERLRERTGLSNGGLNNSLNALEKAGLIRRRRTRAADGRKGPTYYILGCDDVQIPPAPSDGDGEKVAPSAPAKEKRRRSSSGDRSVDNASTVSISGRSPSPSQGVHRLHAGGDYPVIEPKKEQGAREGVSGGPSARVEARAKLIREHKPFLCSSISAVAARECIDAGLVSIEDCQLAGIAV